MREKSQPAKLNRNSPQNDTWVFLFLLHNLHIEGNNPFESDYLAICPGNDPRLPKSTQGKYGRTVRKFINSFQDNSGKNYLPAVMIVEKKFLNLHGDVIRTFRNIAAIATVAPTFAQDLLGKAQWEPKWTDFFDFYPRSIGENGFFYSLDSPTNVFGDLLPSFCGQCSAQISCPESLLMFTPDTLLFSLLRKCWVLCYIRKKYRIRLRRLFRSLEIVYHAGRFPTDGLASLNDIGTRIMLWVSAFEVLCHPGGGNQEVRIPMILNLMNKVKWRDKRLSKFLYRYKRKPINLAGKLYSFLYETRNDFAHGNRITHLSQYVRRSKKYKPLILMAPVLYTLVLKEKLREWGISLPVTKDRAKSLFIKLKENETQENYERALSVSFYGKNLKKC